MDPATTERINTLYKTLSEREKRISKLEAALSYLVDAVGELYPANAENGSTFTAALEAAKKTLAK
ncbi:MAG: hypothetical protein ACTHK7_00730 [Aureliella sp.]